MASVEEFLEIAEGEVGYSRWDDPKPGTKYGRWYAELTGSSYFGNSGVPYCAMFVSYCAYQAQVSITGLPGAYCPTMLSAARSNGDTVSKSNAQPGDIVYFNWDGGLVDHVGIVKENCGSYMITIEGNTSSGSRGSQGNGGVVAIRRRGYGVIDGIVRPNWGKSYSKPKRKVESSSSSNSSSSSSGIDVDGYWGKDTTRALQSYLGTPVDGIVSDQNIAWRRQNPGLIPSSWQWVSRPSYGSTMVKALQRKIGASADGFIGPNTITKLQKYLGTYADGRIDYPSNCVKALQRALNNDNF